MEYWRDFSTPSPQDQSPIFHPLKLKKMKELINQTEWDNKNYVYSIGSYGDNNRLWDLEVIRDKYYKSKNEWITMARLKVKFRLMARSSLSISSMTSLNIYQFEKLFCSLINDLFNADKIKFVKRHLKIKKIMNKYKPDKYILDIYMTNTLLAFIKQTMEVDSRIITILENLLGETEENKRRKEKEVDSLFNMCIDTFKEGAEDGNK